MDASKGRWRIGELAKATGLTVRTLHHYDEIRLLSPSERSDAGHRIYTDADVRRLYRIVSLKQLGFPLADIATMIETDDADARAAVRRHLDAVEEQIELQQELRERLGAVLGVLDSSSEPSIKQLLEIMEVMMEVEKYYTPEQRELIKKRGEEADWSEIERRQKEWSQILEDAEVAMKAGTPPTDESVKALARRYRELGRWFAAGFTGGDKGLQQSLKRVWEEKGDELQQAYGPGPEVNDYLNRALADEKK
jgi:MerR family transcriptional regulator, thiopeptide resistance regulator